MTTAAVIGGLTVEGDGTLHVMGASEVPGAMATFIARDITTTRQVVQYASGAKWAVVSYRLLPGATAVTNQFAKFCINAASDADANGKLATDGAFVAICQGDDVLLSAYSLDPLTRIDFITEQAVGAEKTVLQILAGI